MQKNESIHAILNQFQKYWDESLNGDYKNGTKLKALAIEINNTKYSNRIILALSVTERTTYAHALLLANVQ